MFLVKARGDVLSQVIADEDSAISMKDEKYTEDFMIENYKKYLVKEGEPWDPKTMTLNQFFKAMQMAQIESKGKEKTEPWDQIFGLSEKDEVKFTRNNITKLFNDKQMVEQLLVAMDDPICKNVPEYELCVFFPTVSRPGADGFATKPTLALGMSLDVLRVSKSWACSRPANGTVRNAM